MNFKLFLESQEYKDDINKTLGKLPKDHSLLIKKYKIEFQPNNTLRGDSKHIGFIDEENKKIKIAAPWNYCREFTFLHEIAHAVWKYKVPKDKKKEWNELFKSEKHKMRDNKESINQNAEEIFAMCYANFYTKHKISTYKNEKWNKFIKNL